MKKENRVALFWECAQVGESSWSFDFIKDFENENEALKYIEETKLENIIMIPVKRVSYERPKIEILEDENLPF